MIATTIKPLAPYRPLPWQRKAWRNKTFVLLLTGAAGGGKSRVAAEKLHAFCLKYPGSTALAMRKTRSSMTNSTVIFMERKVIGSDPRVTHFPSKARFEYENGSILAYGGMKDEDQREHIRGIGQDGGLDIVWMEEATKFTETDYQEIIPRMRAKAANWSQIILTTNPDGPQHWIYKRLVMGKEAVILHSSALDNPHNPPEYTEHLRMLTGTQKLRLVDGRWVQAEGAVYPEFGDENVVLDEADFSQSFDIAFDDGYAADPRAILFVQKTATRALVFDEIYHLQRLEEETVGAVLEKCIEYAGQDRPDGWAKMTLEQQARWCQASKIPLPSTAIGSTEAGQLMKRFRMAGITAVGGTHKPRTEGVKLVRGLVCDANQRRIVQIHARCTTFIAEMQSYEMHPTKDEPLDGNDHGCDAFRYWAWKRMGRKGWAMGPAA